MLGNLIPLNYPDSGSILRILYTAVDTPIPGTHGGSVHALELCCALARRGHDVQLVAQEPQGRPSSPNSFGQVFKKEQVEVVWVKRRRRFLEWSAVNEVKRIAEQVQPDVVIERFYTFGGAGIWAAHQLDLPAVLEVNSPARPYPGSWRDRLDRFSLLRPVDRWRRQQLAWSDGIYATSTHLVPPEQQDSVTVITNGVDPEMFYPGSTVEGPLRCVYASSFRAWHGAVDLINAVSTCLSRGVDLRVVCLGNGPTLGFAKQAAERAGVLHAITFLGDVPYKDVPKYFSQADVGLAPFNPSAFPALQLGWFWSPIKIFEYLAAGLVVVTIDIEELRLLLPSDVARFYAPGDTVGMAAQLEELASDRGELSRIRKDARSLAEARYTWDHQAAVVETVLQKVVQ